MNIKEFEIVKNMNYQEYCNYLKEKYGSVKGNYFSTSWVKNNKISKTKEGLFIHHVGEDRAIMLSNLAFAKKHPYEYQEADNLVYCDYLEHLFLHILICKYPANDNPLECVGIGDAMNFLIPELNDFYSGCPAGLEYKKICFDKVCNDEDCYITLVKRFINENKSHCLYKEEYVRGSFYEKFGGLWESAKNKNLTEKFFTK